MLYTYYKPVEREEHMLFAREIANMYRVYTSGGTDVNSRIVKLIIEDYAEDTGVGLEELYFYASAGLARVYPVSIYKPAMERFIERYKNKGHASSGAKTTYVSNKLTKSNFRLK